jgi:hypothetical protein
VLTALLFAYIALLLSIPLYIKRRLGFHLTARTALLGWMWVVCGPSHIYYWHVGWLTDIVFVRITLSFSLMWIAFIAAMEVTRLISPREFRRAGRVAALWRYMSIAPGYISKTRLAALCSAGLVFMLWVAVTEHQIGNLIRFIQLQGQTNDVAIFRSTVGGSKLYAYNVFLASIAPFLSMLLLLRPAPQFKLYTVLRYGFIAATLLGKATLFNRSAMGLFLVELVAVKLLLRDNRITIRRVAGGVLLVLLLVLPAFYHYRSDFNQFLYVFFYRISVTLYDGMVAYFQYFPDIVPFAMGRNFRVINWLFYGGDDYTRPMVTFAQAAGNYLGVYNAGFVAEAWADFGYVGVVAMSVVLGVSATLSDLVIFGDGVKTRESAAILVAVVYGVLQASATAAQTAMFSGGFTLIPLLAAFLKMTQPRPRGAPPEDATAGDLTESPVPS